jgi:putative Holliday junction resolvase
MANVLAIDVGTMRIGCAVADDSVRIPFPVATWPRASGEAEKEILRALTDRAASILVVGLPFGPNGERTTMCDNAEAFARRIERRAPVSVVYVDESFSSLDALGQLEGKRAPGQAIDSFAACNILARYFDGLPAEQLK